MLTSHGKPYRHGNAFRGGVHRDERWQLRVLARNSSPWSPSSDSSRPHYLAICQQIQARINELEQRGRPRCT